MEEPSALFTKLDDIGEADVRVKLAQGVWSESRTVALVKEWLSRKDQARAQEASTKRDAREEKTLALASRANRISFAALILAGRCSKQRDQMACRLRYRVVPLA